MSAECKSRELVSKLTAVKRDRAGRVKRRIEEKNVRVVMKCMFWVDGRILMCNSKSYGERQFGSPEVGHIVVGWGVYYAL